MSRRRPTSKRPSKRKPRKRALPRRKLSYRHNTALHRFEEDLVVAAMCVTSLPMDYFALWHTYPERFNRNLLKEVFRRLRDQRRIVPTGMRFERRRVGGGRDRITHCSVFSVLYGPLPKERGDRPQWREAEKTNARVRLARGEKVPARG